MKLLILLSILFNIISFSYADSVIVKLKAKPSKNLQKNFVGEWKSFSKYQNGYFKNLYTYKSRGKITPAIIGKLKQIKEVISVENIVDVKATSIQPADVQTSQSKDLYYVYQWGTDFQGQVVSNEVNDLESKKIPGVKSADIGAAPLDELDKRIEENVLVAIIDTGVDFNHPDLKNNIFKNLIECDSNGEIPFDPERSNDENEYPGDCKGWDFTDKTELGSNRPEDFVGHGTHLAGIIAAERNNDIGISGISNKIKILPIKVLSNKSEDSQALGTSDRLSKAVLYAIQMKADVINLSLGWPLSFDKEHLKNAIAEAVKSGVTVVAAAGNNDHSEPIMPCGYEGVICVGSSDPNGKMSDFSNFGAQVDVLAPGNNIFSTYPTGVDNLFHDVNGYEIKSGTSQAAPYVTSLVATLKGIYTKESEEKIKARVYNSVTSPYVVGAKFASGNIINFKKAIDEEPLILKPNFKGFNRVKVNFLKKTFAFEIGLSDFGTKIKDAKISLKALGDVNLEQTNYDYDPADPIIQVRGELKDLNINLLQKFEMKVLFHGKTATYQFEKRFFVDFDDMPGAKKLQILGANPKSVTQFSTLSFNHLPHDFPYYYTESEGNDGKVISVFTKDGPVVKNIGTTNIPKATSILSVHRLDANLDGKADILVRSLIEVPVEKEETDTPNTEEPPAEEEKEQKIQYSYLTEDKLRPLFSELIEENGQRRRIDHSHMVLNFEGVILQELNNFAFGKVNFDKYGEILIPVYLSFTEQLPEADRNPNPFARLRRRVFSQRIYYYQPSLKEDNSVELTTRTLQDNKFIDNFKRKIRFKPFEQVFAIKFLQQSFEDIKKGTFSILLSHESERKQARNWLLNIDHISQRKWNVKKTNGINLNLSEFVTERAFDLTQESLLPHDIDKTIVGYEKSSRLNWEEYSLVGNRIQYKGISQSDTTDTLEFPIKTYMTSEEEYRLYLTPSRIFAQVSDNDEDKNLSFPVHVSSFLPGVLFREQHFPIVYVEEGKSKPALYVDSTQIASRNIYMIKIDKDEIVAPVKYNVNIPESCKALNPVVVDQKKYEYSIQCFGERGKSFLIYIPLED